MRYQLGVFAFSACVLLGIVGCGGDGSLKNQLSSITTPNLGPGTSASGTGSTSAGNGSGTTGSGSGTTGSGSGTTGSGTGTTTGGGSGTTGSGGGTTGSGSGTTGSGSGTPASPSAQVVVASPGDGTTIDSPVHIVASTNGSASIGAMHIYVDSGDAFQTQSAQIDTALNIPSGPHSILVQAWDQSGNVYKSTPLNINVAASPTPPPAPSGPSPSVSQIQRMSGWDSCSACAGKFGDGPGTSHDIAVGVESPSLSGSSAKFWVGGTPWGAALWWHALGGQDDAHNFRFDLDFYTESISGAQALEFDMNQNAGGKRYIYGTECDFRNTGTWRVWNGPSAQWVSTGIGCSAPSAGNWHHLAWEFARSDGQVHFVAVTLDGERHEVDRSFDAIGEGGSGVDIAFQADLTGSGSDVTVWLDNVNVAWW